MIQKPRGTMDILPKESKKWQFIEKVARDVCRKHGFGEIRFPTFEETQLFQRGVGDTTDVVQKEMYTFIDRDGTSYSLRPEGTACVARSVIENGLAGDTMPVKLFYIINCFRHERPQAGRYREFYQFGAELFGATTPSADTELICLANDFLKGLGIKNTTLHVNSIGCPDCRPQYKAALVEYFSSRKDELCDTCKSRLLANPLRILDCKSPICSGIAKDAPKTIDHLCDACNEHFEGLKARLDVSGIDYEIDCNIVRGLDYYSRTVFEFISEGIGSQSTVCGGGRYDGLVEQIGGPKLAGIGFAAGINRLVLTMENGSNYEEADDSADLYIAPLGEAASVKANEICAFLRKNDVICDTDLVGRSLKAQMKYANKITAKNTLIIGDGEIESGKAQIRNMSSGEQTEVDISNLNAILEIIKLGRKLKMAELLSKNDKRTKYCGEFTSADVGATVCVMGWAQKQRDLGGLIFIDLRDRSGIIQLAFDENTPKDVYQSAFKVRSEFVLCAKGIVRARGEGAVNKNIPTGEIEIAVNELKILSAAATPPFAIVENSDVKPELRLKHRYLDLRRPDMQSRIIARSKIAKITRDYFEEQGFIEIETPNLVKPTPEGARDYLVPSRVHPGSFYALPQSPQLYKQLLMLSGFDRYLQIARCYRDEDLRADRQPEFTQIDEELSFVTQDDVIEINEGFLKRVFKEFLGRDIELPLPRMTYAEAMERFGSDKPDLRFGYELKNLSDIVKNSEFKVFSGAIEAGGSVRAINIDGGAKMSRKEIDSLVEFVKTYRAKGLAWYKYAEDGSFSSSYAKFLTEDENKAILDAMSAKPGDLILIVADAKNTVVFDSLGALRREVAFRLNVIKPGDFKMLWITEFPLLEYDDEDGRFYAKHHPFTMPMEEDLQYLDTDPGRVRAIAYDIVINGTEAGGGSVRINIPEIQQKMFSVLGMEKEEYEEKFGFLLEAYRYGAPPHAGLAFGFDRLVSLLLEIEDIRDVIAFPKVQNASELMTGAPAPTDMKALNELSIAVVKED